MLKTTDAQLSFGDATFWCADLVDSESIYGKMARYGHDWFRDDDFKTMYSPRRGRPSLPPSLLAAALVLQNYDGISDRELAQRLIFDLRYKVALRLPLDFPGVDPSIFSVFRARLIAHNLEAKAFERGLERARTSGVLNTEEDQAIDSMPIAGAAAVQDTYTLIRTGVEKTLRAIDKQREDWEGRQGFQYPFRREKYLGQKRGKPDINWDDEAQKQAYLGELVKDARSLLAAIDSSGMMKSGQVAAQCELLRKILLQDLQFVTMSAPVARQVVVLAFSGLIQGLALPIGLAPAVMTSLRVLPVIKKGGKDRTLSTNDPEMRHGHKSKTKLFDGFKGHFTVGVDTELVITVEVTPANVADNKPLDPMVTEFQLRGFYPGKMFGDGAYGSADCRAAMEARGIEMVSKLPVRPSWDRFPKSMFVIDLKAMTVTCPAGQTTAVQKPTKDADGRLAPTFKFAPELCAGCPLREQCIPPKARSREIQLHHREEQLQKAREQNAAPGFRQEYKKRLVVERVQSRLKSYSLRVARYFGVKKVKLQALFTAAANNFWRVTSVLDKQREVAHV